MTKQVMKYWHLLSEKIIKDNGDTYEQNRITKFRARFWAPTDVSSRGMARKISHRA
jgi:hypothetical protein